MPYSVVQEANNDTGSAVNQTTVTATFAANMTAGNTILCGVAFINASQLAAPAVKDGNNNSFTEIDGANALYDNPTEYGIRAFYYPNCAGGVKTVVLTGANSSFGWGIYVAEVSGLDTSPLDVNAWLKATATLAADNISLSKTNTSQPQMLWCFSRDCSHKNAPSAGTGFTALTTFWGFGGTVGASSEHKRLTTIASQTATMTNTGTSGDTFETFMATLNEPSVFMGQACL